MTRLIDADALSKRLQKLWDIHDDTDFANKDVWRELENAPTIDAVKHGRWEIYVISMLDGEGCKCSECGTEGVTYWNFCPNCGARMDGEENG